jgi:hypothetical protein
MPGNAVASKPPEQQQWIDWMPPAEIERSRFLKKLLR